MAVRWRIAILLAVITTINYIDRSVFGMVAPVVRGEFGIGDADYGLITSGFLLAYGGGHLYAGGRPWRDHHCAAHGLDDAVSGLAMGLYHPRLTGTGVGHTVAALVSRARDTPGHRSR